jgi:hypothetical protein
MKTTHTFTREEVEEMIRSWCGISKDDEIVIENKIYVFPDLTPDEKKYLLSNK